MVVESSYPLDGVRSATTGPQQALVLRAVEVMEGDPRILAGYLVGGFAVGQGDAYSDVGFQFLASDDATGVLPRARALAARTGATWPAAYERASVGFFERMLGVSLDVPS